jgi:hypothetical protein
MSEALASDTSALPLAAQQPAGMTRRVVGGSLWSAGGQGVTLLASLVATPFVLRLLGAEGYGVLALINVLIGYLAFTGIGVGAASTGFGFAPARMQRGGYLLALAVPVLLLISVRGSLLVNGVVVFGGLLAYGNLIWRKELSAAERAWMLSSWQARRHRKLGQSL